MDQMREDGKDKEENRYDLELTKKLRKKRVRKYSLGVLAVLVVISTLVGLKFEDKDALLADGQGNIAVDSQTQMEEDQEEAKDMTAQELSVDNSDDPTASNGGNQAYKPDTPEPVTVTISIRCDTLSQDMSQLENPAIKDYIPEDGAILNTTTYQGTTDNTVFDVLNTVCRNNNIQLEFSYTPLYQSYYIEGINYLYEFDGGNLSGWMYKVNGWYPNYGCSSYYLRDGDVIEWVYTCNLGKDVGAD